MFEKSSSTRHKNEIQVSVTVTGRDPFDAAVFIRNDERLIDLLNDDRLFIPVKTDDETTVILGKASIVSIVEHLDQQEETDSAAPAKTRKSFDPYKILRISPEATLEEIRSAYKNRLKTIHPDMVAALDLDEDLTRAAHLATLKVNRAYQIIIRDREAVAAEDTAA